MKNAFKYSAMALGLATAVYAASNPVLDVDEGNTLLIDNFEDGDLVSELGDWIPENDNGDGGLSTIDVKVVDSGDEDYGKVLQIDYSLNKGKLTYNPQVMTFVTFDEKRNSYDVSNCLAIEYDYKGASHKVRLFSPLNVETFDYNFYQSNDMDESSEWSHQVLSLSSDFRWPGWGARISIEDIKKSVYGFDWFISNGDGDEGTLQIDNVKCQMKEGYNISFVDGSTLLQKVKVGKGEMPEYTGETPQKESDKEYDYFFVGWEPEVVEATENASYQAVFDKAPIFKVAEGETVLVEDFEDGDFVSNWGGSFSYYSDADEGGGSDLSYDIVEGDNSKNLKLTFMLDRGDLTYTYAGLVMDVAEEGTRNLSSCKVIRYDYKGAPHNFRVQSGIDVGYQYHQKVMPNAEDWTQATIVLEQLEQPRYETTIPADIKNVLKQATAIEWQMTGHPESGTLEIDNIRCANVPLYEISFYDDGKLVETQLVPEGEIPECKSCWYKWKMPTAQYRYEFNDEFTPELAPAVKNASYEMVWTPELRSYEVTFNVNGALEQADWEYGSTPEYKGGTPTKEGDAEFTYTFAGWDPEIAEVTGEAEYVAQFDAIKNKYKVSFVNDGGEVIATGEYEYGTEISTLVPEKDPTLVDPTGAVTYVFDGWSPEVGDATVTGEVVYTATYKTSDNKYTVTFMNGNEILQRSLVKAGEMPVYSGDAPTREADAQYTYTWNAEDGWTEPLAKVAKSVTYVAKFTETLNKYTVTFKDDNGTVLGKPIVYEYGDFIDEDDLPDYVRTEEAWHEDVEKYGWDDYGEDYIYNYSCHWPEMDMVTGDATYTLECDYRVTFIYGSEVYAYWTGTFAYGETPEFPDWYNEPSKGETPKYTYTFKGWKPDVVAMGQHSATYEAEFEEHIRQYSVKFLVGSEEISSEMYDYETPVEKIVVPTDVTKASTAEHSYKFIGWDKDIEPVTKNVMYKAVFEETDRVYVVTFTVDGETVAKGEYAYGTLAKDVAYPEGTPTKEADAQYTYTFFTWCALPVAVTEDITCAAEFETAVNAYTITFVVDGKKTEAEYDYGTKAADLQLPETKKAATDQYTYTFKAWDKALAEVTEAATYTALFDSTVNKYTIAFVVDGKKTEAEYAYGTKAADLKTPETKKVATAQYTYTFKAWDKELADVTGAATYTAVFDETVNKYKVTFVVDGKETVAEYAYGTKAADLKTPETKKAATAQYTYTFKEWNKKLADVTETATYTAVFDETVNKYKVTFVVDGKETVAEYAYGTKADDIKVPTASKEDTEDMTFTFDGWDKEIADVTEAVTYTAKFTSKKTTAIAATVHGNFKFGFANNELTVEQPGASMVRVQVFDLTGHLVESFNEQVVGSKTFSLAHLNQGSYMVRVVSKSQIRSARITVR